jgi:membrane protein YdbS with pleckstrin-like domain
VGVEADIRNVEVSQGILGRQFGFGTVSISSSTASSNEVSFDGIPNPERVSSMVLAAKDGRSGPVSTE